MGRFVYPIRKLTFGISRQEVLNTKNATLNRFTLNFSNPPDHFSAEGSGFIEVHQTCYNASAGYRVSDRLAFGASLARRLRSFPRS